MSKNNKTTKVYKEILATFFEEPTRDKLREILKDNLGEFPELDFKESLPVYSKIAKHILAMGNSGQGCIVIGVTDKTLEPVGITKFIDKKDIEEGIKKYLPDLLFSEIEILDFIYEESEYPKLKNKSFQIILIYGRPEHLPYVALKSSNQEIIENTIYIRRGTSSVKANYEELQGIINRRIETGYSSQKEIDLKTHIQQLKLLYSYVDNYISRGLVISQKESDYLKSLVESNKLSEDSQYVSNPQYPQEDMNDFILKLIEKKKKRIEIDLDVFNL